MHRRAAFLLAALALTGLAGASHAQTAEYGFLATISNTMGVQANRLCLGEGTRGDIGCPTYAPSVDSMGLLTTGNISSTGNISANRFIGDGSGLTGVVAASGDRIVSGTTSLVAVSSTGFVSLTQAGVNTGWFDPQRGLVTLGVSTTGPISGTSGMFSAGLNVNQSIRASSDILLSRADILGPFIGTLSGNSAPVRIGTNGFYRLTITSSGTFVAGTNSGGSIGTPSTTLQISGTLRLANGGEACDADRTGAIRYTAGDFSVCRDGMAWETLSSIVQGTADRITSGTTSLVAVSETGFVSLTQAGTNTGWFDPARGLVTLGVSATGTVSATGGFFAGNVGIGINNIVGNPLRIQSSHSHTIALDTASGSVSQNTVSFQRAGSQLWQLGLNTSPTNAFFIFDQVGNRDILRANPNGNLSIAPGGGNAGIGTWSPLATLHVSGTTRITSWTMIGSSADPSSVLHVVGTSTTTGGIILSGLEGNRRLIIRPEGLGSAAIELATSTSSLNFRDPTGIYANASNGNFFFGRAGGTPSTTLHVSGTIRMANGGEACDANRTGAIRYTAGDFSVCRNGMAWETLTAIAGGATPDRIVSGSTSAVASGAAGRVDVSGSLAATGGISTTVVQVSAVSGTTCTMANIGQITRNPVTGRLRMCRL